MAFLKDINAGLILAESDARRIESIVVQLNEWARLISNESITKVFNDESGTPRILLGQLPDKTMGLVVSKVGVNAIEEFN